VAFEIAPISGGASIIFSPLICVLWPRAKSLAKTYLIDALHFACCPLSSNSNSKKAEKKTFKRGNKRVETKMLGSHCNVSVSVSVRAVVSVSVK